MKTHYYSLRHENNAGARIPVCQANAELLNMDSGRWLITKGVAAVTCANCKRELSKRWPNNPANWEWVIGEGVASWHQQRAGHTSAGYITGFGTREAAEAHAAMIRSKFPDRHLVVHQRRK